MMLKNPINRRDLLSGNGSRVVSAKSFCKKRQSLSVISNSQRVSKQRQRSKNLEMVTNIQKDKIGSLEDTIAQLERENLKMRSELSLLRSHQEEFFKYQGQYFKSAKALDDMECLTSKLLKACSAHRESSGSVFAPSSIEDEMTKSNLEMKNKLLSDALNKRNKDI
jgi:uncharacterized coiled-coil protein SlyX